MPWTPAPGGVAEEQRKRPSPIRYGAVARAGRPSTPNPPPAMSPPIVGVVDLEPPGVHGVPLEDQVLEAGSEPLSICDSIALVMSTSEPDGTWQ